MYKTKAKTVLFHKLMDATTAKLDLATTYLEDGALASAALNLMESANYLMRALAVKNEVLEIPNLEKE